MQLVGESVAAESGTWRDEQSQQEAEQRNHRR
jgi:hypothetical protein